MDTEALRKSLLSKFREVTADRLEKIGLALLALEKDPSAPAPAEDVARELHTMKGEARMMGLPRIGEVAHACEDLLKASREGRAPGSVVTDQLLQACDLVGEMLEDLPTAERPNDAARALCEALARAARGGDTGAAANGSEKPAAAPPVGPAVPGPIAVAAAPAPQPAAATPVASRPALRENPLPPEAPRAAPERRQDERAEDRPGDAATRESARSIRVNVDALDSMAALAGDLLVEGARSGLRGSDLGQLVQRINRLGDRFLALADIVASRMPEEAANVAWLESDLHLLRDDMFRFVRRNADGLNTLRGLLQRMAEQVAEARLVPLSTVFAAFPRAVRDIARQQGKEIELTIGNAELGVDRGVLGDVRDAMVHLLRNAVDHGIEPPDERGRLGKPRTGRIEVSVRSEGDMLSVTVEDDGRGIDPARLRETAVARGLISLAQAAALTEREVLDLIFLPGFSTREEVTDISGRGVGMAVVKKKVEALGGSVAITTRVGRGTRFGVRLPQSMALMRVLLVRLGNDIYGIPAADVQAVGRVQPSDRIQVAGRHAVKFRDRATTLVELAPLLKLKPGVPRKAPPCVYVQHGQDRAAFVVDGFLDEREVAVKPCGGEFLKSAPFLAGAAALEDGRVAVLLHVPDIMLEIRRSAGRPVVSKGPDRRLRVLLVDDSPIARATESTLVRALGHTVDEAFDGVDGLSKVALQSYDLVISDVQMPRMDGIEMTRRLKSDPATARIPVVIMSSLSSPEDRRRGLDAGADGYLVKGDLSAESLAQTLGRLTF